MNNLNITLIKNTSFIVAYNGKQHYLLKNGELAYKGNQIIFVGKHYSDKANNIIDAKNGLVIPGLINFHCHMSLSPVEKGFFEDLASPNFYMSGLYEYLSLTDPPPEEQVRAVKYSLIEIVKKGTTTVFELGPGNEDAIRLLGEMGIRAYIGSMSRCGSFFTSDGKKVEYSWDVKKAYEHLENSVELYEKYNNTYNERINIAFYAGQSDTCTPDFLKETRRVADDYGMLIHIHAAQSIIEYQKVIEQYGKTPAEYLTENGIAGPDVIYGHYFFPSGHSMNRLQVGDELKTISETCTSIAHCPWVFGRRGFVLESLKRYQDIGINVGIGTDTIPQDMIREMRDAAIFCKIAEQNSEKGTAAQVFNAATLWGAKALGRCDIGRLCAGAKADIVIVDTNNVDMFPLRDPIKALIYSGSSQNIHTVIIDGNTVVENGRFIGIDEEEICKDIQEIAQRAWDRVKGKDWAKRTHLEMAPMSFPVV